MTHLNTDVYKDLKKEINDERLSFIIVKTNHEALEKIRANLENEETEDGENGNTEREISKKGFESSHKYNNLFLP